ncbi:hypothetical protein YC2023_006757 [Brassica napus]
MAYATGVTPASRSIFPICSRALLFRLRVASILESSPSTFFTRVQAHQLFSTSRAPLFSSVKCSTSSLETAASRPNVVDILEERGLLESITSENLRSACSDPSVAPTAGLIQRLRVYTWVISLVSLSFLGSKDEDTKPLV